MFLDLLFQIWRRFSGHFQWWSLWLVNSKFMVSVSGIIFDEQDRVLLQRHRHWVRDVWGLPGGIVQSGETLEQAFAHEVFEETNLAIANIQLIRVVSNYRLRLEVYFQATLTNHRQDRHMQLQEQEIIEARFFPLEELPSNLLLLQKDLIENIVSSHLSYA